MRRGFKAEAERLAVRLRGEIDCPPNERIDVDVLAQHLGVEVRAADEFVSSSSLKKLDDLQPGCFSAATIHLPGPRVVAILNTTNSNAARRDSNLAHELAHIILQHEPRKVDRIGDLAFFDCDPEQEQEANWLAGCLLLPRTLLLADARKGLGAEQIAQRHAVSLEMARYRLNASGVYFQVHRGKRSSKNN